MLLMQLTNIEKFAFLQIAHFLAHADGEFDEIEQEIIKEYCIEMGIDDIYFEPDEFFLHDTLKLFKSKKAQKILLLELMILVHVDDRFNHFEQKLVNSISGEFGFSQQEIRRASSWGKAMSALREQAFEMLNS